MRRAARLVLAAMLAHALAGWVLAGTSAAAQLLSPGPHAVLAGAWVFGFVLLRVFVLVIVPGLVVLAALAALGRSNTRVVR